MSVSAELLSIDAWGVIGLRQGLLAVVRTRVRVAVEQLSHRQ